MMKGVMGKQISYMTLTGASALNRASHAPQLMSFNVM